MIFKNLLEKRTSFIDSGVTNPQDWLINVLNPSNSTTFSGEVITSSNAIYNSNVYTCVDILSDDVAKLPIKMYRTKNGNAELEINHPVSYLLRVRPNPYMSAFAWQKLMEAHTDLWGNAYNFIEWGVDGRPKALWPLHPSATYVWVDYVSGEVYYETTLPSGEFLKLEPSNVLHFQGLTNNGVVGISKIQALREKLGIQQSMDKFSGSFYANGTTTRGILKVPTQINKDAKDKAREEWQNVNTGISNAFKIAVLDGGMEYQNLGMPLKDAEFIESMKFGILEVAKIFKVPPHKLGQLDRATFSNIESQSMDYVKNVLQPRITNREQELNYKLLLPSEQKRMYIKVDMSSELRGDSAARVAYYEAMVGMGAMSLNEVRSSEDMDSMGPQGDIHRVDLNHVSIDIADDYQKAKAGSSLDGKGGDTNDKGQGNANADSSIGSEDSGGQPNE